MEHPHEIQKLAYRAQLCKVRRTNMFGNKNVIMKIVYCLNLKIYILF